MEIIWKNHVKIEVLDRVKVERDTLYIIKSCKANWIGHILRTNCLLKYVIGGRIEVTGRRGRRRKQLLDDLKETTGYWKLKEEALDRALCETRFGSGCGSVLRQTTN
jgi:hypothetical protein